MDLKTEMKKLIIDPIKIIFKKISGIDLDLIREIFFYDFYNDFPYIRRPIEFGRRFLRSLNLIKIGRGLELKFRLKYGKYNLKFNDSCQVNPKKIQYWLEGRFNSFSNYSRLLKREWENRGTNLVNSIFYRSFESKFKEGKKWEETEFYHQILNQISLGIFKWGCNDKKQLDEWLKEVDSLYFQIKQTVEESENKFTISNEIYKKLEHQSDLYKVGAVINKDGHILIYTGIQILLIAGLLDIPKVTVQIMARHNEWISFKKRIIYIIRKKTYQILTHPDLKDIPYLYGDFRFNLIKENLSTTQGTLLDIGSHFGYFSHKFEDDGFNCYAVEYNPYNLYFLKKLKLSENKKFKVIPESIFDIKKNQELAFDVVLALNVFHHFLKRKESYLNLIKLLKRLKVKELFLGIHHPREFQKIKVYQNFNSEQFVNFILENSCLNKAKLLGRTKSGRPIYKLYILN